ncbi:glycoside hydrolase family 128 protein [Paxillus rubicundulus Ve08.2h10]|uniref:Glycoside hydrolase family 128 protein n=1 Tax=Paxillus rubicundulus Ve08.2h10 TaxID=930991 RepID=A0A0D0E463_9AGAM|nr:glycoside hydrolase family 128 protein [Paxillus rubicundulus Ve08.2h10]
MSGLGQTTDGPYLSLSFATTATTKSGCQGLLASTSTANEPSSTSSSQAPGSAPAAPRQSDPVASSVSKKWGLAWPNGDAVYLSNLARPKVRNLYTWSPHLPSGAAELGFTSIPVDDFKRLVVQGYATHVLGMNEHPQDGASLWEQYVDPLKNQGYYLISLARTNDQAGLDWMKGFVEACDGCKLRITEINLRQWIDAVAFHFYGMDPGAFIEHATTLHNAYNKPIWTTEFADQNFSGSGGQAPTSEIYAFQSAVITLVGKTPWIEAASPFGVMYDLQGVNQGNALLTGDKQLASLA